MKVLAMSFFDDVELALLVELKGGLRLLGTIVYAKFVYERIEPIKDLSELSDLEYEEVSTRCCVNPAYKCRQLMSWKSRRPGFAF
jgi:hypothetical protein